MKQYHPKILGFKRSLKKLRATDSAVIRSTCVIELKFEIETHVPLKNVLGFEYGTNVYYVDLKAPDDQYARSQDTFLIKVS